MVPLKPLSISLFFLMNGHVVIILFFFHHILGFIFSSHLVCECLVCVSMSGRRVNAGDISQDRLENDLLNNTLGTHRDPLH